MKALIIGLLVFACWWVSISRAAAESVIVTEPWVKVRAEPAPGTKAIGLAYGNDRYELMDAVEGWYLIVTANGKEGWIPAETAYEVIGPIARKSFAVAEGMRTTGRSRMARAEFFHVMQRFPGTIQGYEAVRHLLSYYPVGDLPALEEGRIPPGGEREAERVKPFLFIEEGRALLEEGRLSEARSMFEQARISGVVNFSAMDGIRESLQREMQIALAEGDREHIEVVRIALKGYFPDARHRGNFRWIDPETGRRVGAPPPAEPLGHWTPPGDPMLDESGDAAPVENAGDAMESTETMEAASPAQMPPGSEAGAMDEADDDGMEDHGMDDSGSPAMEQDTGVVPMNEAMEGMPADEMQNDLPSAEPGSMEDAHPDDADMEQSGGTALPPPPVTLDQLDERPGSQAP